MSIFVRDLPALPVRLRDIIKALAVTADIVVCTAWLVILYLVCLADKPTGRQMVSAYAGRAAINGHKWAARVARVIDWMFVKLGDRPDHCRRMARKLAGYAD